MTTADTPTRERQDRWLGALVLLVALALALVSARPYAGSWNDGSRLATVETLVDQHTLAIDRSIFVKPPAETAANPYPADESGVRQTGTLDRLLIHGHYYSDKSPVPALLLAGFYQLLQWLTGLTARGQPGLFCFLMTLGSSVPAYAAAVWCVYRLGRPLGLALALRLLLAASFALGTVALCYGRHVNNHILLLGVVAPLVLELLELAAGRRSWVRLVGIGTLAGLGYTVDLGAGPVLWACTLALVAYRCRQFRPVAACAAATLPWLLLHHAVNYAVGGTLGPANAVAAYFQWPGCPFTPATLTGGWQHGTIGHFLVYAAGLLLGKRGFLVHNLPLLLTLPGVVFLLPRRLAEMPELLWACFWSGGTWLAYALNSTNYSGDCCSIRWFVPLLAPGYLILALLLREQPRCRLDLLVLSGWGGVLAALAWWLGPWMTHLIPGLWPIVAGALLTWFLVRWRLQGGRENSQRPAFYAQRSTGV